MIKYGMAIPKYDDLFNPVLQALHELGSSASVQEIENKVADILNLTDQEVSEIHSGNRTVLGYRLAWARNYLKRFGVIESSSRGVWSLTAKGNALTRVAKNEVNKFVKSLDIKKSTIQDSNTENNVEETWQDELLQILRNLEPSEFERLCQRILRESGFVEVNVTGKSGDGGIDGTGLYTIGTFLTFRIRFQCKRYKGSVSSPQIREFRGSIDGHLDKGLFLTTGTFTRDAKLESSKNGAIPIDLIDGEELVNKMRELGLGVKKRMIEVVEVDKDWFSSF